MQTTQKIKQGVALMTAIAATLSAEGKDSPLGKYFTPTHAYQPDPETGNYVPTKLTGLWIKRKPGQKYSDFLSVIDGGENTLTGGEKKFLSFLWKATSDNANSLELQGATFCFYANPDKGSFTLIEVAKGKVPKGAKPPKEAK